MLIQIQKLGVQQYCFLVSISRLVNSFQLGVAVYLETSPLNCSANQMTDFHIKYNTGLEWVKNLTRSFFF